jgi:flagellar biosynthesis/type III secretory pathway protein FliH
MRTNGALFSEDFDRPDLVPEPEATEPAFSPADLAVAREAAWRDGRDAGLREAAASDAAAACETMKAFAEQFALECDASAARAETAAEALARLLIESLAAMFPTLCTRYGDAEVRAVVRTVLPALTQEPAITVRAHPCTAKIVGQEARRLDPDLAGHVHVVECDAMAPGDVKIAWHNGSAVRDAAALWRQVAAVLAPTGLLPADTAIDTAIMETVDGN